jgi:hypothetical protein
LQLAKGKISGAVILNMILDVAANPRDADLLIDAVIAPKLSFATHQNDVPVIRELKR